MSTESPLEVPEKKQEKPARARSTAREKPPSPTFWRLNFMDLCLIALFLALTFLLGAFPLKDTDFYWHLRAGDWIRETGHVPRTDLFTFTRVGVAWIDLHWIFQIAISWVYQQGGVVSLNLAKCTITCVAMLLLLSARRRDWPVWVIILAWLPALLVLGGRMYVRPETLSLLYLSVYLAILLRWERWPRLALLLPLVQVAWVNSHGLFVLGPIVLIFGLIDAVLRFGFFDPDRRKWWRTILVASLLVGAACLFNPYFITGALYPLELAGTMSNPIFSQKIAELKPIPDFIREAGSAGWLNLPIQLQFTTMILGALSFLIPLVWLISGRLMGARQSQDDGVRSTHEIEEIPYKDRNRALSKTTRRKGAKRKPAKAAVVHESPGWRLSPFRLLLYVAFSYLSLRATRNSHQFATVVGTITAWNFGEWAASVRRRRLAQNGGAATASDTAPRLLAFSAVLLVLVWVGSGLFYKMTGEGRVIGLGEEPVFFAHEAARFAGEPGMPGRFLSFHNGHASLFEYYHGPERKVYTDPRLEVAGADLFKNYIDLSSLIKKDLPGWEAQLNDMGRPVVMVDHEYNWDVGATLFRSAHWRCVWFDAIVAVFVHDSNASLVNAHAVDFAARHFRDDASADSRSLAELKASAKAFRSYAPAVSPPGGALGRPFYWLGIDDARRVLRQVPDSSNAWKLLGQIELFRAFPTIDARNPRFRASFDPVLDLSMVRATYALRRALELTPRDFSTLLSLRMAYDFRLMYEPALPLVNRLASLYTTNLHQFEEQAKNEAARAEYAQKLGSPPATTWRNLSDLDQIVTDTLAAGRAESAAVLLERAYPPEKASWEMIDKMATLHLHLGEPIRAREIWRKASTTPQPGIKESRIGTTYLAESDFDAARGQYEQAIKGNPELFEAHYCLAVLEQDAGHAPLAYSHAMMALKAATEDISQSAARAIATAVTPFARGASVERVTGQSR